MDNDEQFVYLEQLQRVIDQDPQLGTETLMANRRPALAVWHRGRPGLRITIHVDTDWGRVVYRWPNVIGVEPLGDLTNLEAIAKQLAELLSR